MRPLLPLPWAPPEATLTRSVVPVCRSWTNTSDTPFVSPATRSVAALSKATKRPSAERAEPKLVSLPSVVPPEATLTRSVVCAPADRPQRTVSSTRATELRTRRCVGGMAPPVRREGAALTVAAFAKNAGHGFTISIAATGRCTSGGEGGNLPLPQGRHRVILGSLLAGAATRFVRRHSTWRVMTTPSSNSFLADVGAATPTATEESRDECPRHGGRRMHGPCRARIAAPRGRPRVARLPPLAPPRGAADTTCYRCAATAHGPRFSRRALKSPQRRR